MPVAAAAACTLGTAVCGFVAASAVPLVASPAAPHPAAGPCLGASVLGPVAVGVPATSGFVPVLACLPPAVPGICLFVGVGIVAVAGLVLDVACPAAIEGVSASWLVVREGEEGRGLAVLLAGCWAGCNTPGLAVAVPPHTHIRCCGGLAVACLAHKPAAYPSSAAGGDGEGLGWVVVGDAVRYTGLGLAWVCSLRVGERVGWWVRWVKCVLFGGVIFAQVLVA